MLKEEGESPERSSRVVFIGSLKREDAKPISPRSVPRFSIDLFLSSAPLLFEAQQMYLTSYAKIISIVTSIHRFDHRFFSYLNYVGDP